jgi:hypothetical protein
VLIDHLVLGEQVGGRASAGLIFEIETAERLPARVADDARTAWLGFNGVPDRGVSDGCANNSRTDQVQMQFAVNVGEGEGFASGLRYGVDRRWFELPSTREIKLTDAGFEEM